MSKGSRVVGGKALDAKLQELGGKEVLKVLRPALRAALKPTMDEARVTVPVGTRMHRTYMGRRVAPGFAKRTLRTKVYVNRDTGNMSAVVGVGDEAFYAVQFWEFGARNVPRNPWLTPAFKNNRSKAISIFVERVRRNIEKVAKK